MASLRDIKARIASTKNIKKITRAMEMVSAAKLNRAQAHAQGYMPYTDKLRDVVASIAAGNTNVINHPMLESREVKKTGYLVITADRGLAGGYNSNVLRRVTDLLDERHASRDEYTLFVIGKIGVSHFKKRNMPIAEETTGLPDHPSYDDIKTLAKKAVERFADEDIDELYMVYNHFVSAISQKVRDTKLLPLTDLEAGGENTYSYEYEPSAEDVLETLLPQYIEGLIYGALLDAKAAEQAARMTAMRSATDNADELIDDLTLDYNSARQAAITQEISEIAGGAAALE